MKIVGLILMSASAIVGTAAHAQSASVPTASLPGLFSADDYPVEALENDEQGKVRVRLDVSSQGGVTNCSILSSSGSASLDTTTCAIIKARAQFTPAKDDSGKAIDGTFESTIHWKIDQAPFTAKLNAVTQSWINCANGHASTLLESDLSPDEIIARSFTNCTDAERRMEEEMERAELPGMIPSSAIKGLKVAYRTNIGAEIVKARRQQQQQKAPGGRD